MSDLLQTQNTPDVSTSTRHAPGPNFLGSAVEGLTFIHRPFNALHQSEQFGPIVRYQMGRGVLHLIHRPADVQHVLLDNNRNYHKCSPYALLKLAFGRGLLFNEGQSWFAQRRLLQPAFQEKQFGSMIEGITQVIQTQVDDWTRRQEGQKIDIEHEMSNLSRRIVGQMLFGSDLCPEIDAVMQGEESKFGFLMGNIPMMPHNLNFRRKIRQLNEAIYRIIGERRRGVNADSQDMLNALMKAVDKDSGEVMDDTQLRDEIVTLLFSGFDTTSRTLAWVFHALGEHPHVEARLHDELQTVLGERAPQFGDLRQLTYTQMLVKETMRLFPANPIIGRQAKDDDEIAGFHIPAGSFITLSPYLAHRDPESWEDPLRFDPERWAPERPEPARFTYYPFGGGARQCIGKGIAMTVIPLAIATIAQRYLFRALPDFVVEHDLKVTFQSRNGVLATRHLRTAPNC